MRKALAGMVLVVALAASPAGASNGSGDGATISIASGTPRVGSSASPSALHGAADVAKLFDGIPQAGLVLGDPNAPVTLIEYVDLQCPLCQQFETTELPQLVEKFVRPGKLKIELQPWAILDRSPDVHDSARGQKATIAAAAQNKAFNFAEVLYDNQGPEGTGWLNDATISKIAASVDGLDPYQLATDANGQATQKVIASVNDWANSHPTQMLGTPTIYLAKGSGAPKYYVTGVPNLGPLEAAISALLKGKPAKAPGSGGHGGATPIILAIVALLFLAGLGWMTLGRMRRA
jgi:protein-disulfide isomerase